MKPRPNQGRIDALDVDAAILLRLDIVCARRDRGCRKCGYDSSLLSLVSGRASFEEGQGGIDLLQQALKLFALVHVRIALQAVNHFLLPSEEPCKVVIQTPPSPRARCVPQTRGRPQYAERPPRSNLLAKESPLSPGAAILNTSGTATPTAGSGRPVDDGAAHCLNVHSFFGGREKTATQPVKQSGKTLFAPSGTKM